MQEGSLRCDANVNLHIHKDGTTIATPIVEIKNLNSFRAVEKALLFEIERQYQKWRDDGLSIKDAAKTTRGWNDVEEVTKPQREKETAADYRYFPEPDLVPVEVDCLAGPDSPVDRRASRGPPRPVRGGVRPLRLRRQRLGRAGAGCGRLLDAVARATGQYKLASNWIQQDVLRTIKEKKMSVAEFPVSPASSPT